MSQQKSLVEKQELEKQDTITRIDKIRLDKIELEAHLTKMKQDYTKIKGDPDKYRKQADVSQTALKTLKLEAEKLGNLIGELDVELNNQSKKRKEDVENSMQLAVQLDKYRNLIDQKEKQCNEIIRDSETEEHKLLVEQDTRAKLEMELKKAAFIVKIFNHPAK